MILNLSLPLTRICVNISTVYNDTLVAKGLMMIIDLEFYGSWLGKSGNLVVENEWES